MHGAANSEENSNTMELSIFKQRLKILFFSQEFQPITIRYSLSTTS
jgi:hypothetical protein